MLLESLSGGQDNFSTGNQAEECVAVEIDGHKPRLNREYTPKINLT